MSFCTFEMFFLIKTITKDQCASLMHPIDMREVLKNTNLLFWDFVSGDWFQSVLFYFVYTIVEKTYIVLVTKCWKCYIFLFKVFNFFYLLEWTIRNFIKCIVKSNYRFYQGVGWCWTPTRIYFTYLNFNSIFSLLFYFF